METNDVFSMLKFAVAGIGGLLGAFIGEMDGFFYALAWIVVIDYITGVLSAAKRKELSSEIGFWGIVKKMLIFVMVGICNFIDVYVIHEGAVARTMAIFFYMSNEGLSILENMTVLGVPFPDKLKDILAQLKDKGGKSK